MSKLLAKIENIIFLVIVLAMLAINIYGSTYMLASYWVCLDFNKVLIFLISLLFTGLLIYLYKRISVSKKIFYIFITITTIASFLFRLHLNRSFNAYPTSDQFQSLQALNDIINEGLYGSLEKGGYFSIHSYLTGLIPLFYLPVKLFKYDALGYYDFFSIIILISIILLTLSIKNFKSYKEGLFLNLLFTLFIPSYFLDFVTYGDSISLLFISISVFLLSIKKINQNIKILIISLLIGIAYMARSNSVVWFIALLITYIVYSKLSIKTLGICLLSIVLFLSPSTLNKKYLENKHDVDLKSHSMPVSNYVYIGTGYSLVGDAGIYNPLGINTIYDTDLSHEKTNEIMKNGIKENLSRLGNPKELVLFIKRKIQNTWADPDFETMGFVMPNEVYYDYIDKIVSEGYRIPVGTSSPDTTYTNNLGKFVYENFTLLRDIEKIFTFSIYTILLISAIIRIKNENFEKTSLFLQLNTVGFFLLQMLIETKPRYVLISFFVFIVLTIYELNLLADMKIRKPR